MLGMPSEFFVSDYLPGVGLEKTRRQIWALQKLEKDWDSYGSVPIDHSCMQRAVGFILAVGSCMPEPSVVPCSHGGVQLEWHQDGVDLEIEFKPGDKFSVGMKSSGTEDWHEFPPNAT